MHWLTRLFLRHLEDDEEIVLIVHKHWLIGFRFLVWPSATLAALVLLLAYSPVLPVFYIVSILGVISLIWWFRNFFDYYLDAWIITNTGIIDVEWHGWFHRESSRVLYSDIQGVSYEINGVWQTLFRHGTISVEKVSTGSEITMEYVPRPRQIESLILSNMEEYMHQTNLNDASKVHEILTTVIARELHLRQLEDRRSSSSK